MRIAIFSWEAIHGIPVTPVAVHVSELARTLARLNHDVHVFTRGTQNHPQHETIAGVSYHRPGFEFLPDLIDEIQNMCRAFVDCLGEVERDCGAFDLIHAHDWTCCNAGVWAKETYSLPLIITLHSIEYARSGTNSQGNAVQLNDEQQRIADHEANGCNHADRIIAVSHSLKRDLMQLFGVEEWRSEIIYNGADVERYEGFVDPGVIKAQHGFSPMDPMVLFLSPLEWRFGPDLLLEAAPRTLQANPKIRFLFASGGSMRAELQSRVLSLGLDNTVHFAETQNEEERIDLYRAADLVCVPSRNDPFSVIVPEAWAASKPVVVTQIGGPGEYVWHEVNGIHVHATPDSVAWGIDHCFRDFEWARWIGRNGRVAAEAAFTWSHSAEQTEAIYKQVINNKNNDFQVEASVIDGKVTL